MKCKRVLEMEALHNYVTSALIIVHNDETSVTFDEINFIIRQLDRLSSYYYRTGYSYLMIQSPMRAYIKIILNWIDRNVPSSLCWGDNIDFWRLAKLCKRYNVNWH